MEILEIFIYLLLLCFTLSVVLVFLDYKIRDFKEDQEEQFQSVAHKIDKIKWLNRDLEILDGRFNDLEEENKKLKTKLKKSRKENKELERKYKILCDITVGIYEDEAE